MTSKTTTSNEKTFEQREEEIKLIAYSLWQEKGSNHGSDVEDWNEAEKYLNN